MPLQYKMATGATAFLATPTSANLAALVTDETGSGANVFGTSPTLVTPALGAAAATSINGLTMNGASNAITLTGGTSGIGTSTGKSLGIFENFGLKGALTAPFTSNNLFMTQGALTIANGAQGAMSWGANGVAWVGLANATNGHFASITTFFNGAAILGQTGGTWAWTATPSAGQSGFYYNAGTWNIYNNMGGSRDYTYFALLSENY